MLKLILLSLVLAGSVYAENDRHMISISSNGFGWSGSVEKMSTESKSDFSDLEEFTNNFALNYAYRVTDRQQLGFFVSSSNSETTFDRRDVGESETKRTLNTYGLFVLHNFHSDLNEAWYTGLGASITNREEEISHDFADSEGKAPIEVDDMITNYEIVGGKRFSLKKWNIENLVYSPQVNVFYRTHGKDFDDQRIDYGWGAMIQPIKFDLLF